MSDVNNDNIVEEKKEEKPEEEMIPAQLLKNRLAEKDRKHNNEISALKSELAAKQNSNDQQANLEQNYVAQIAREAIQNYQSQQAQKELEQQQMQQAAEYNRAKGEVYEQIRNASEKDPEFKKLAETVSLPEKHSPAMLDELIGRDNAADILKKLMSSPEILKELKETQYKTGIRKIINKIASSVQAENLYKNSPAQSGKIYTQESSSKDHKDPENMNSDEYRKYLHEKGSY